MGMQGRYRPAVYSQTDPWSDWNLGIVFQLGSTDALTQDADSSLLISATMSEIQSSVSGFTTYELIVELGGAASNVYAMYGNADSPMSFPPAYGVGPRATGGNTWLTIGRDVPESAVAMAGIDLDEWSQTAGWSSTDALVFVTPDAGASASAPIMLGQITVRSGSAGTVTLGLQGQSSGDAADWQLDGVQFSYVAPLPPVVNNQALPQGTA